MASFTTTPTSIYYYSLCLPQLPPSTITLLDLPPTSPIQSHHLLHKFRLDPQFISLRLPHRIHRIPSLPQPYFGTISIALILLFGKTHQLQPACGCGLLHCYRFPIYSLLLFYKSISAHVDCAQLPTATSINCLPHLQTTANANCRLLHTTACNHAQLLMSTAMETHTQQPEVCAPCGQQFEDWQSYIRHMITSGNHPHACTTCGQEFLSDEGKQKHQRQVCTSPSSSITVLTASGPSTRSESDLQRMPQRIYSMRKFGPTC